MTITYIYNNSIYVNPTNRCTNNCDFCVRTTSDGFYSGDPLWLEREPTINEMYEDIIKRNPQLYNELVFCGYGEPTMRLADIIWVARKVKMFCDIKIRLNTNGHCNLIYGEDMTPLFEGAFDIVSVSLNTADAVSYDKVCHSVYGEEAYDSVIDFAAKVKEFVPVTILSVVRTTISDEDIEKCRIIAEKAGVQFRIRELV